MPSRISRATDGSGRMREEVHVTWVWMVVGGFGPVAHAGPFGSLRMPVTPHSEHRTEFHALIKKKGAGAVQWTSRSPGFTCKGEGDFVEVWVRAPSWPGQIPEKVWCDSELGAVKAKVDLYDEVLKPMFVGDGSLVLVRHFGESVDYEGLPPRMDVGVQQGNTGELGILCKIKPGPKLIVEATSKTEDGVGACRLRTTSGEMFTFPLVLRSAERAIP